MSGDGAISLRRQRAASAWLEMPVNPGRLGTLIEHGYTRWEGGRYTQRRRGLLGAGEPSRTVTGAFTYHSDRLIVRWQTGASKRIDRLVSKLRHKGRYWNQVVNPNIGGSCLSQICASFGCT